VSIGHAPLPAQGALATLIEDGLLARHVRKMRRRYAARHALVLATLSRDFGRWLVPVPSVAGLHVAARLRSGGVAAEGRVAARARRVGVGFDRLSGYFFSDPEAGVVLGYGAIPDAKIAEGLRRLRACFALELPR
jgi:GntR family transcriptional regulator/MocR family aminotransferase